MKSPVIKRTVYVNGRKTGICLEDAFWSTLKEIAHAQGATVSQTVTEIDKLRRGGTLSARSACSCSTGSVQKKRGPPWGKTAAPNKRRAREALGGDRTRHFPVAGGVPALNERAQPLLLVGGEVSIHKVLWNLGDVAQIQAVLALPIFVCFAE